MATAGDAAQGTKRKEKKTLWLPLPPALPSPRVSECQKRGQPMEWNMEKGKATNGSECKWAKASTIGKLKDVPQNSMLRDTIITKYGISDRSTEYPCAI